MKNNLSHIALILDGNKRWAKNNNLNDIYGYKKGFENIKNITKSALSLNLENLTLFALSSENFKRSSINIIFNLIYENFSNILNELIKENGVRINIFGLKDNLPLKIIKIFDDIEKFSKDNNSLNLNIAFNYGFKNEIKNILKRIINKEEKININNQDEIDKLFNIGSIPDPDLLIRTGGYQRLSNFIMYKLTYTELFFTKTLWPDFTEKEFNKIINEFLKIRRKYGL